MGTFMLIQRHINSTERPHAFNTSIVVLASLKTCLSPWPGLAPMCVTRLSPAGPGLCVLMLLHLSGPSMGQALCPHSHSSHVSLM